MILPELFPTPQKVSKIGNPFTIPHELSFFCSDEALCKGFIPLAATLELQKAGSPEQANLLIQREQMVHYEAYFLKLESDQITLRAESAAGVFRALSKLYQILNFEKPGIKMPGFEIEDSPILNRRGFMLDISRCKVPTMEELFRLIDLLALIGYNELQLYIEHTFQFKDHEIVWKNASPISAEEIQQIDRYCLDRFIELVPNLNSFGHFERWLCHQEYKHMAECPDGFVREEPYIKRNHGTTLKPNAESLNFMDSLYEEYLPNFSSKSFNVGMDEPWELGQGWSAPEVRKKGKEKVYLNHLDGIRKLVEKHGKKMLFWADVLLEKPENARYLPKSASPIIWGYEADHPFAEQAAVISSCNLDFTLAPGTGSWRSFSGRWHTARANIESATLNALKYQAKGILLTSWGDCGNHQPWPCIYPAMFLAAQTTWNGKTVPDGIIGKFISKIVYQTESCNPGQILMNLGELDLVIGSEISNASLAWNIFFSAQPDKVPKFLAENQSVESLKRGIEHLRLVCSSLEDLLVLKDQSFQKEILLGTDLSVLALEKGLSILCETGMKKIDAPEILYRFQSNWLEKARPGGLNESTGLLENALISL